MITDDEIAESVKNAVMPIIRSLPAGERRSECVCYMASLGYELMRGINGNEFARDWLNAALADLETKPPFVVVRELQ